MGGEVAVQGRNTRLKEWHPRPSLLMPFLMVVRGSSPALLMFRIQTRGPLTRSTQCLLLLLLMKHAQPPYDAPDGTWQRTLRLLPLAVRGRLA